MAWNSSRLLGRGILASVGKKNRQFHTPAIELGPRRRETLRSVAIEPKSKLKPGGKVWSTIVHFAGKVSPYLKSSCSIAFGKSLWCCIVIRLPGSALISDAFRLASLSNHSGSQL